jgi:hypothetical protein
MEKFYQNGKEVPSIEGVVEKAQGGSTTSRINFHSLELKIDTFDAPVVVPGAYTLRIDAGEKIRLYSYLGFKNTSDACGGYITIDALEILGEDNKTLFRYVSSDRNNPKFK